MPTADKICALDSADFAEAVFGRKAAVLATLTNMIPGCVPPAFCVAANADLDQPAIERAIEQEFAAIHVEGAPLIVRSSALVEDLQPFAFAGRFDSVRNNYDVASVMQAIRDVRASASSPRVREYLEELGVPAPPPVAAIVQRQISPEYSGVIFSQSPLDPESYMVELIPGDSAEMLRGTVSGRAFHVQRDTDGTILAESLNARGTTDIPVPIDTLMSLVERIGRVLKHNSPHDIEWCAERLADGSFQLHIVQVRTVGTAGRTLPPLRARDEVAGEPPSRTVFPDGTKAYAANFFRRLDLGPPGLVTIRRNQTPAEVRRVLDEYKPGPSGTTIRLSDPESTIGLTRAFVAPTESLAERFFETQATRPGAFGIIHHYMPPDHSFEAYVDDSFLVVEHVPGIWESDSQLRPDLFVFEHGERPVVWRYSQRRVAVLKRPGRIMRVDVDPIELTVLKKWADRFEVIFRMLRRELRADVPLPVNIHFIGSRLREEHDLVYSFLNLRLTQRLRLKAPKTSAFHVLNGIQDLATWDRKVALLLRVTFDRGDERQALIPIAKEIRYAIEQRAKLGADPPVIYAEFGILSHPAIVLREFGVHVQPFHMEHEMVPIGPQIS